MSTGPWESGLPLPTEIKQPYLPIVMGNSHYSRTGDSKSVCSAVPANSCQWTAYITQFPDLNAPIVRPRNNLILSCKNGGSHGSVIREENVSFWKKKSRKFPNCLIWRWKEIQLTNCLNKNDDVHSWFLLTKPIFHVIS